MNLQIAQVYLQHADATMAQRTWQDVMDAMFPLKSGPTQARWQSPMDSMFDRADLYAISVVRTATA